MSQTDPFSLHCQRVERTTFQGWTERGTIKAVLDDPSVGSLDRRGKSLPLY